MPPKKIKSTKKTQRVRRAPKQSNDKAMNELVKLVKRLDTKPQSQVTDLGRFVLNAGNHLGSMLGFPKILGSGAYTMNENTLWTANKQVPVIHSSNESVILRHREYIGDVSMNGATFSSTTYAINPGLSSVFPYLSSVASCFQEYKFRGLVFEYKTTSATAIVNGTNSAMGAVMMAVQYRADAAAFTSKIGLLNEMWSVDTVPSNDAILPVECAPVENPLAIQYIRSAAATGDIKMFDLGTLTVATAGAAAGTTNVVGELWVSYEIELFKPQISGNIPTLNLTSYAYYVATNFDNANIFGTSATRTVTADTIGLQIGPLSITFPVNSNGYYAILVNAIGTSGIAMQKPTGLVATNGVAADNFTYGAASAGSGTDNVWWTTVKVTGGASQAVFTWTTGTAGYPGSPTALITQVISLPPAFGLKQLGQ